MTGVRPLLPLTCARAVTANRRTPSSSRREAGRPFSIISLATLKPIKRNRECVSCQNQRPCDAQEVAALRAPHMFRHIFERYGDTPRRLGRNARPDILLRARLDGGTAMWPRPDKSRLSNLGR